jgi:hypothetical protein
LRSNLLKNTKTETKVVKMCGFAKKMTTEYKFR